MQEKWPNVPKFKEILYILILCLSWACAEEPAISENEIAAKFKSTWHAKNDTFLLQSRKEIAALAPKTKYGFYCRAWLFSRNNNFLAALKTADSMAIGFPSFAEGQYLLANLREENGDPEAALKAYSKALKAKPDFFEALVNRGNLWYVKKDFTKALQDFKLANSLDAKSPINLLNLGNAFMALGFKDSACVFWEKSMALGATQSRINLDKFCKK